MVAPGAVREVFAPPHLPAVGAGNGPQCVTQRGDSFMFRLDLGRSHRYCDGLSRRSFLQLGVAGMASLGLGSVWQARAASAQSTPARNTSVILLWLDGGP